MYPPDPDMRLTSWLVTRIFPLTVVCFSTAFNSALVWSAEQLNYKDMVHIREDDDDDDDCARILVFVVCFLFLS